MIDFNLTKEQKIWFDNRMSENEHGRVIIEAYCYVKFKKIVGNNLLSNLTIKVWLIDKVYNSKHLYI
jgi:hypothetical protein